MFRLMVVMREGYGGIVAYYNREGVVPNAALGYAEEVSRSVPVRGGSGCMCCG